jgi:hypothetical protein
MTFLQHVSDLWTKKGEFRGFSLHASQKGVVLSGRGSSSESAAMESLARELHKQGDCPKLAKVAASRRYDRLGEPDDDDDLSLHLVPKAGRFDPEPPKPRASRVALDVGFMANRRLQAGLNENLMDACDDVREQIERYGD